MELLLLLLDGIASSKGVDDAVVGYCKPTPDLRRFFSPPSPKGYKGVEGQPDIQRWYPVPAGYHKSGYQLRPASPPLYKACHRPFQISEVTLPFHFFNPFFLFFIFSFLSLSLLFFIFSLFFYFYSFHFFFFFLLSIFLLKHIFNSFRIKFLI